MSAGARAVTVAPRFQRPERGGSSARTDLGRPSVRLVTFTALAAYGVLRWEALTTPAPSGRLLGLLVLSVALVGGVPLARQFGRVPAIVAALVLCLLALPVAGLPWHLFVHVRLAVSARRIADGVSALPAATVPFTGADARVQTVITLGAAALLLDAAIVLAFAPASFGDLRRAAAALPLIALAVVPSALVRPQLPYVQGVLLFVLLAGFMWGERVHRDRVGTAMTLAAVAAVAGAIVAPWLDEHHPWVNFRGWAGALAPSHVDAFNWSQSYGPLDWPRGGRVVLTVSAARGDYWKAQDLDVFNGYGWAAGNVGSDAIPLPPRSSVDRFSQTISVRIGAMRTDDVIAAGFAGNPPSVPGGAIPGEAAGTWVTTPELGPGATYTADVYSPQPSPRELIATGARYPRLVLDPYRTIALPQARVDPVAFPQLIFPAFQSRTGILVPSGGLGGATPVTAIERSPYGPVYALAQRLAARAANPYAFAVSIERYLGTGYRYDEEPPARQYPLVSFLFRDRIGYCQQFAGAMALLLRMGGVPARVAAGFTSGSRESGTDDWVVSDIDAHAWVEAWFPRYGWVRFDPTPSVAPARGGVPSGVPLKGPIGVREAAPAPTRRAAKPAPQAAPVAHRASSGGPSLLVIIPGLAGLALLAWAISISRRPNRDPDALLAEVQRALARTRRPLDPGTTLVALEHRFRDSADAAGYIRTLRLHRYRGTADPPSLRGRRALREQLAQGLGMTGRLRALWALPPRPVLARRIGGSDPKSHRAHNRIQGHG